MIAPPPLVSLSTLSLVLSLVHGPASWCQRSLEGVTLPRGGTIHGNETKANPEGKKEGRIHGSLADTERIASMISRLDIPCLSKLIHAYS